MRFFAIIFSIYLLATSCFPCSEAEADNIDCKKTDRKNSDSHKQESSDICSPLCVCGCCTGTTFEITENSCEINFHKEITLKGFYFQTEPDSPLSSIWQPPKLS